MTKEDRAISEAQLIAAIVEAKKFIKDNEKRLSKIRNSIRSDN